MKSKALLIGLTLLAFTSCGHYNKALKSADTDFKYEYAKQLAATGRYNDAAFMLTDVIPAMKGTEKGDEPLFLYGMWKYLGHDYVTSEDYLKKYCQTYPTGHHVDEARFYAARSLYMSVPTTQLDQTDTYDAITQLQSFLEIAPESRFAPKAREMIFELQDQLIEKEYQAARLYYNLGTYFGNCTMGGNNYEACIITSENALKDYPYASRKEDFAILILKAKYELALSSVKSKQKERYTDAIDEYYGFVNQYPNSSFISKAKEIYEKSQKAVKAL